VVHVWRVAYAAVARPRLGAARVPLGVAQSYGYPPEYDAVAYSAYYSSYMQAVGPQWPGTNMGRCGRPE
jgi:hypothetical protein